MTREPTRWTEETIARTVGTITPEEITEATAQEDDPPELWPYLDAASVLTTFDPRTLVQTAAE